MVSQNCQAVSQNLFLQYSVESRGGSKRGEDVGDASLPPVIFNHAVDE